MTLLNWPNDLLSVSSIVGHTTDSSTRLWFRTDKTGDFIVFYWPKKGVKKKFFEEREYLAYSDIRRTIGDGVTGTRFTTRNKKNDTCHVIDLERLAENTEYYYSLWRKEGSWYRFYLGDGTSHSFKTQPKEPKKNTFALLSCHMPFTCDDGKLGLKNIEMWKRLGDVLKNEKDIRCIIYGGDQAYIDGISELNFWTHMDEILTYDKQTGRTNITKEMALSWYREMYRGYWGIPQVKEIMGNYPGYMIWDDHEVVDGWGSYLHGERNLNEIRKLIPSWKKNNLSYTKIKTLLGTMKDAAFQAYAEYEHSHNPKTKKDVYDYSFSQPGCAFYILDGRGYRDFNRKKYKTLGTKQIRRFQDWLKTLDVEKTPFIFD